MKNPNYDFFKAVLVKIIICSGHGHGCTSTLFTAYKQKIIARAQFLQKVQQESLPRPGLASLWGLTEATLAR